MHDVDAGIDQPVRERDFAWRYRIAPIGTPMHRDDGDIATQSCGASSVVRVTSLTMTVPETVDAKELESEIVTAQVDRLRDDHGYGAGGSET